ncbi:MAG: HAD-IIIA family hydrolase [Alphaproteobacteria bacterium]|nr:HAD-IIIA family hydrolase [Alphaproteobacteria bacterium]
MRQLPRLKNLRAVIFDRDGTLNASGSEGNGGYVLEPAQLAYLPGVETVLKDLHERGILLFVFTQQNCVTKGLIDEQGVDALHDIMQTQIAPAAYKGFYFNTQACAGEDWSKPGPGMLNAILAAHPELNASNCLVVGDAVRDAESAAAAGLPFAFVASDQKDKTAEARKAELPFYDNLATLFDALDAPVPYAAYEVDKDSREMLLEAFPPRHPDVIAHHITHKYGATEADMPPMPAGVRVTGHHDNGAIQVLVVEVDGKRHQAAREDETPRYYHITLSIDREQGIAPKNSNDLLQAIAAEKGLSGMDNLPEPIQISVLPRLLLDET